MKELTIIILSYNVKAFLRRCLESIINTTDMQRADIVVVDNNSNDNSAIMVRHDFPDVQVINNRVNVGFAAANNIALKQVNTEFMMLLNPDVIVKSHAIDKLVDFLKCNKNAGMVGPKIMNPDGSLQISCRKFPGFLDALYYISGICRVFPATKCFRSWLLPEFDGRNIQEVECISGACIVFRKRILEEVGLLDERFFLYAEDVDFCRRMKRHHRQIFYLPAAEIIHYGGQSSRGNEEWRQSEEMFKSWLKYRKKHYSFSHAVLFNLAATLIFIGKITYLQLVRGKVEIEKVKMYTRLLTWYLRHIL